MIDMKYKQYHITSNRFEYTVSKMKMAEGRPVKDIDSNGHLNIVEQPIGHYSTLELALKGIRNYSIRVDEPVISSLEELRAVNRNIEQEFDDWLDMKVGGLGE